MQESAGQPVSIQGMDGMAAAEYRPIRVLGKGGMSTVYLAEHIQWKNQWAVKQVHKNMGYAFDVLAEPNLLKQLSHPMLPRIIDIFEDEKDIYIVEEYIDGEDLQHYLDRCGPIPEELAVQWFFALADVLKYLHSQKPHPVIYRDLKPANIMRKPDGNITLIDFGIARKYKKESRFDTLYAGTRGYAAPEQLSGTAQTDARTDIYTLGATMHHLLTGIRPSPVPNSFAPVRSIRPELSRQLESIITKCLQPAPENRYASMDDLLADLALLNRAPDKEQKRKQKPEKSIPERETAEKQTSGTSPARVHSRIRIVAAALCAILLFIGSTAVLIHRNRNEAALFSQKNPVSFLKGISLPEIRTSLTILHSESETLFEDLQEYQDFSGLAKLLFEAFRDGDYTEISGILNDGPESSIFSALCSHLETGERYFLYDPAGEGNVLAVYQYGFLYYGGWKDGIRTGEGIWFAPGDIEELRFAGTWENDLPNGKGTIYSRTKSRLEEWGDVYPAEQKKEGSFTNGYYDGVFKIHWTMSDQTTRDYSPVRYSMGISSAMTSEEIRQYLVENGYPSEQAEELAAENTRTENAGAEKKTIAICKDSNGKVFTMIELTPDGEEQQNDVFGIHMTR